MALKFRSKDNKYRRLVNAAELNRLKQAFLFKQTALNLFEKQVLSVSFAKIRGQNMTTVARVRNGCVVTGRTNFIFRFSRFSRMQMKNLSSEGFLVGVVKSS